MLDPYQKTEDILSKAGFAGFYVFFLRPDQPGGPPLPAQGYTTLRHYFRLKSSRGSKADKRLGDFLQTK